MKMSGSFKAVLLAGGKGERAKPFSEISPKVLIPMFGRPVIDYIVRHLVSFDLVDEVIVVCGDNSGHSLQIRSYFEGKERLFGKAISFVDETFGGTAGALLSARRKLGSQEDFLVWFGDNLVPLDVDAFHRFHKARNGVGSVVVSSVKRAETGFVEVGSDGQVLKFKEKPLIRLEEPESLGIYLFKVKILDYIEEAAKTKGSVNLSFDVLERLNSREKLFCFDIGQTSWMDIESPTKVERNIEVIKDIIGNMNVAPSSR